jgi:hypothetical protein
MNKTVIAKDVNEQLIENLTEKYVLIQDKAASFTFDNMIKAINLFAEKGWRCVNITAYSHGERLGLDNVIFALMEKEKKESFSIVEKLEQPIISLPLTNKTTPDDDV